MDTLFKNLAESTSYLNKEDKKQLYSAYLFAKQAHKNQTRKTGEEYICHPVGVACKLASHQLDKYCLIAALLHDILEDTQHTLQEIMSLYGDHVAAIVDGVSRIENYSYNSANEKQAVNFSKMLMAMAKDLRVILIKIADRLHNINTVEVFNRAKQIRIAKETLEIYAPIACKMGLGAWQRELEDNCFKILYPKRNDVLQKTLNQIKGDRKELVNQSLENISEKLKENNITLIDIHGREKSAYSIFKKMKKKGHRVKQIKDLFAFRIIVSVVDECYLTLGIVHRLFRPLPGKFKDYIALPKPNGYQSLHTILINSKGVQAEVQIRTKDMNDNAENGIAAHWRYKSGKNNETNTSSNSWLNNLMSLHQENSDLVDFWETAKQDLAPQEVFVFTPHGELINLPAGSKAIDFAYAIHSKMGNHAINCYVNSEKKPLDEVLENGDIVEIFTSTFATPSPEWLNIVVTAKARNNIRDRLKKLQSNELRSLGKQIFVNALEQKNINTKDISGDNWKDFFKELAIANLNELFSAIGTGERSITVVTSRLLAAMGKQNESLAEAEAFLIDGKENIVIQFGKCCGPIYPDNVVGYMGKGKGLVIHRDNCSNIKGTKKPTLELVKVKWSEPYTTILKTRIRIVLLSSDGLLAEMVKIISQNNVEINDVKLEREISSMFLDFELFIAHRTQLANLLKTLKSHQHVVKTMRISG